MRLRQVRIGLYQKLRLRTEKVSDEMAKTLADGFGVLVEVLKALGTLDDGGMDSEIANLCQSVEPEWTMA